ncbi:hypothetical protein [Streptomyces sp. CC77]|uniref:hypothetical protein n=1 Tax=Streptomyces sp. CC77 TaxID=1906739 RepID=UPI0008DC982D|nr:hypothetical protein [Streptomyces sp. CC77]OII63776.1 hypothetical protein BJP39_09960 [Streptomyces sp. CC77]
MFAQSLKHTREYRHIGIFGCHGCPPFLVPAAEKLTPRSLCAQDFGADLTQSQVCLGPEPDEIRGGQAQ